MAMSAMDAYMIKVYTELIRKGKKAITDVPEKLRREAQRLLEQDNA